MLRTLHRLSISKSKSSFGQKTLQDLISSVALPCIHSALASLASLLFSNCRHTPVWGLAIAWIIPPQCIFMSHFFRSFYKFYHLNEDILTSTLNYSTFPRTLPVPSIFFSIELLYIWHTINITDLCIYWLSFLIQM